ncbi:MAG: hypothetical protein ACPKPY_05635 [Nitrososphaeraceae archaeon]
MMCSTASWFSLGISGYGIPVKLSCGSVYADINFIFSFITVSEVNTTTLNREIINTVFVFIKKRLL